MKNNVLINLIFAIIGAVLVLMADKLNSEVWTGIPYAIVVGLFGASSEYLMVESN